MAIAPMDGSSTSRKASMAESTKPRANPRTIPTMMQLITRMPISHTIVAGHLYLRDVDGIYCRNLCNPTK